MATDPFVELEQSMGTMADVDALSGADLAWLSDRFFGATLTAVASGLRDYTVVRNWIANDDPASPSPEQTKRLAAAVRAWFIVAPAAGRGMALSWFMGIIEGALTPGDDRTPATLCREGEFDLLEARAKTFRFRVETDAFS